MSGLFEDDEDYEALLERVIALEGVDVETAASLARLRVMLRGRTGSLGADDDMPVADQAIRAINALRIKYNRAHSAAMHAGTLLRREQGNVKDTVEYDNAIRMIDELGDPVNLLECLECRRSITMYDVDVLHPYPTCTYCTRNE